MMLNYHSFKNRDRGGELEEGESTWMERTKTFLSCFLVLRIKRLKRVQTGLGLRMVQ